MNFQVLINFSDKRNKALTVATSEEEFKKTTVLELKKIFCSLCPQSPEPSDIRVVFGRDLLEDNQTLAYYKVKHLSVLFFVLKMPGGGEMEYRIFIDFDDKNKTVRSILTLQGISSEEFNNTTIRELKEKFCSSILGAPEDPDHIRVIFGKDPLEYNQTLGFYKVEDLSVLRFELKTPGTGGRCPE
ncbi:uncharacterized protein LOC130551667 isoform X2 [Triplophysa rosa]|uniref:uncharacterized protein LOC130551667 isoform X2 n=1 Tax=Triplophysa rosa TaxID=992332 RepID=UPI0025463059|nr:uncharacterized protein LOC130551667 isoform X2 [Triplophysa rosa]